MWSGSGLKRHYTEDERPRWGQHNVEAQPTSADGNPLEPEESPESGTTAVNTEGAPSRSGGTWGERDTGPVNQRMAMEDYEALRRELTTLSKTRSGGEKPQNNLQRVRTGESVKSNRSRQGAHRTQTGASLAATTTADTEAQKDDSSEEDDFELDEFMREGHFEKRKDGVSAKKVGVVFKNL